MAARCPGDMSVPSKAKPGENPCSATARFRPTANHSYRVRVHCIAGTDRLGRFEPPGRLQNHAQIVQRRQVVAAREDGAVALLSLSQTAGVLRGQGGLEGGIGIHRRRV